MCSVNCLHTTCTFSSHLRNQTSGLFLQHFLGKWVSKGNARISGLYWLLFLARNAYERGSHWKFFMTSLGSQGERSLAGGKGENPREAEFSWWQGGHGHHNRWQGRLGNEILKIFWSTWDPRLISHLFDWYEFLIKSPGLLMSSLM